MAYQVQGAVGRIFIGSVAHCTRAPEWEGENSAEQGKQVTEETHEDNKQENYETDFLELDHEMCVIVSESGSILLFAPLSDPEVQIAVQEHADLVVQLKPTQFLVPGFIDTHIHAPQYSFAGTAMDKHLMEWLTTYTFPAERDLAGNEELARDVLGKVVDRTLRSGTTTALYFATLDLEVSKTLVDICVEHGQRGLVGKISMDANSPEDYSETTEQALQSAEAFITYVQTLPAFSEGLVFPVVTPRFLPTSTSALLTGLGELASKYDCHVQSHLSESLDEVEFSKHCFPGEGSDTDIFKKHGLLTQKSVMAHAVHLSEHDIKLMISEGAAIAHCPLSNFYFAHGILETAKMMRKGVKCGLGTDVAGGYSPSMFEAQRSTVVASFATSIQAGVARSRKDVLSFKHAFYLATLGGATALGLQHTIGKFAPGYHFDALVLDLQPDNIDVFPSDTLEDKLQKLLTVGDDRNVAQVYVKGKLVCDK